MSSRRCNKPISALVFCLAVWAADSCKARYGSIGAGHVLVSQVGMGHAATPFGGRGNYGAVSGAGSSPFSMAGYGWVGGYGTSPYGYGYGVQNGQVGPGYYAASQLYGRAYQPARSGTVTNFQPLMSAITSLPGWNAPTYRVRRRSYSRPSAPRTPSFDDNGKILWPSTIPDDPASASLRRAAEEAVRTAVYESKTTGHGSVRLVIDAMHKLSAFEHKVLPVVKNNNSTDGAALELFFHDLDQALDALTHVY
jgi:hypothetical protein